MATVTPNSPYSEPLEEGNIMTISVASGGVVVQRIYGSEVLESINLTGTRAFGPYVRDMLIKVSAMPGSVATTSEATDTGQMPGSVSGAGGWIAPSTWAALPAASSVAAWTQVRVTDYGNAIWYTDGTFWKPVGGIALLYASHVDSSVTGTTAETTLASVTIKANSMALNGSLEVTGRFAFTNNANAKVVNIYLGATSMFAESITTSSLQRWRFHVANSNSQSIQKSSMPNAYDTSGGWGVLGSSTFISGAINTAADTTLAVKIALANSADTATLSSLVVTLVSP